jgi:hypothetical protein
MFGRFLEDVFKAPGQVVKEIGKGVGSVVSNVSNAGNNIMARAAGGDLTSLLSMATLAPPLVLPNAVVGATVGAHDKFTGNVKNTSDRLAAIPGMQYPKFDDSIARFLGSVAQMRRMVPGERAKNVRGAAELLGGNQSVLFSGDMGRSLL